ncbi:MAG: LysE family transporter [Leptothrix sp. (in: b-proteobacteria)]
MQFDLWLTFLAAAVAISLSPGPGAIAALSAGLQHGFRRAQPIAFGLLLGVWTQLLVVGVGVGVLLAASGQAFAIVKWIGAAYLVWLGVQQWRATGSPLSGSALGDGVMPQASQESQASERSAAVAPRGLTRALVLRGWVVNALNPKGTVFLLAVLPQFIEPARPLLAQYLAIGATFGVVECLVMSGYAALAARLLHLLRTPRQVRALNRVFGGLFVLAGAVLVTFKRSA